MPKDFGKQKKRSGDVKQVIILRKDFGMKPGKLVAQGAHASLMSFMYVDKKYPDIANEWISRGETKIVLKVNTALEFDEMKSALKKSDIPYSVVRDAGQTQVPPGSETAIGIGPYYSDEIDKITKKLKLL